MSAPNTPTDIARALNAIDAKPSDCVNGSLIACRHNNPSCSRCQQHFVSVRDAR